MQDYNKRKKNLIFGYLLLFASIYLLSMNYLSKKKDKVFSEMNFKLYALSDEVKNVEEDVESSSSSIPEEEKEIIEGPIEQEKPYEEYYIGYIEIPKINLRKGFVSPSSPDNDVSKNVQIVETSDMPDVNRGNFILAAHSGNSYVSYFKDLYLLNKGDYAYVTYQGVKYVYKITNIYLQVKTGQIGIYRDNNKTTLTLVTCTKDDEQHQTIYIAELISKNI